MPINNYLQLAELGHAKSQCNIARMYNLGDGVDTDLGKAFYWYREAAEVGNAKTQYQLGEVYMQGISVPQNKIEAYTWLSLALKNGFEHDILNKKEGNFSPEESKMGQNLISANIKVYPSLTNK